MKDTDAELEDKVERLSMVGKEEFEKVEAVVSYDNKSYV